MDLKNISKDPKSYSHHDFRLYDLKNDKYYAVQDNVVRASQNMIAEEKYYKQNTKYITIMDNVNPDDTKIGSIAFDVNDSVDINNLALAYKEGNSIVWFKLT